MITYKGYKITCLGLGRWVATDRQGNEVTPEVPSAMDVKAEIDDMLRDPGPEAA